MDDKLVMFEDKMGKSLANLEEEFAGIRAGRANPHVLDKLRVDYYGTPSPIQSVANVSVPEPRMIQIQPWEASMVKEIEKAILSSDLGINPTNDGKLIRLVFPELTEERRKELAKDIKKKGEGAKVAVRNIRRDAMDHFKKVGKAEDISEDEREHDHRQKRLKECPEHTENRVPVLELNVLANDLGEKETVLIKILEVFLHPDHLHFFI